MFKLFKKHLEEKSVSYSSHASFAMDISLRLALSSVVFLVHAIFPFVKIPDCFNLEAMSIYLFDKNQKKYN